MSQEYTDCTIEEPAAQPHREARMEPDNDKVDDLAEKITAGAIGAAVATPVALPLGAAVAGSAGWGGFGIGVVSGAAGAGIATGFGVFAVVGLGIAVPVYLAAKPTVAKASVKTSRFLGRQFTDGFKGARQARGGTEPE